MAHDRDPKLFEIVRRQVRQNIAVNFVFVESCFVLAQPEAAQPHPNVHRRFLSRPETIDRRGGTLCLGKRPASRETPSEV